MGTFQSFWLLTVILSAFFDTGLGIQCHQCSSRVNPKCDDPMQDLKAAECNMIAMTTTTEEMTYAMGGGSIPAFPTLPPAEGGEAAPVSESPFVCIKFKVINNKDAANSTVVRGCYMDKPVDICEGLNSKTEGDYTVKFCGLCKEDGCNGSDKISSNISLTATILPFFAVFYFLRQ